MARVRLHAVPLDEGALVVAANGLATAYAGAPAAAQSLARLAMSLRRFDACLLPVTPETLGWTRTALSCARQDLHTPLIGLARGLKAAAVEDLLTLGMRDFVRDPFCPEELRVRVDRVASGRPVRTEAGEPQGREPRCEQRADEFTGAERTTALHEPAALFTRYGATADTPSAATGPALEVRGLPGDSRPRVSREAIDSSLLTIQAAPRIHPDEPFRVAKSRVVDSFERDYVRTALSRHAGNVARAARASSKHRRAFWALMRKHRIEAAPYRMRQERREMSD
jgi:DNA-binding NtrC family response regulator